MTPFVFLSILINYQENLQLNPKVFADDIFLFSVVKDHNSTADQFCNDLRQMNR